MRIKRWYRQWGWVILLVIDLVLFWVIIAAVIKLWPRGN